MSEILEHYIGELVIDIERGRLTLHEAIRIAGYIGRIYAIRCLHETLRRLGHPDPSQEILEVLRRGPDP